MVAGNDVPKPGFSICPECGTLHRHRRDPEDAWRNHALYCSKRKLPESATQDCLFLYREFDSEGIRLYLPESVFADSEQSVHSFIAALHMGLELRFRGAVDHLRVARDVRIAAGQETPRQYLVIYDSVPGGTGYLKELMRDASPLFEVFQLAAQQLVACACNSDESKDGCYQCLYGYHNSYDRRHVSRRRASAILAKISEHRGALKPVGSIGEVTPSNSLFDSELERRFIEALRRRPADGSIRIDVKEEIIRGKPGYLVSAGETVWSIEPQVELGPAQGVVIPCKPDFVFWPENVKQRPIAVFLDGWGPHKDRIGDDLAKRLAISRSEKFDVWSLTSSDIAMVLDPGAKQPETPWPSIFASAGSNVAATYERFRIPHLKDFHARTAVEQFRLLLQGIADADRLRLALVLAIRAGVTPAVYDNTAFAGFAATPSGVALSQVTAFNFKTGADLGRIWSAAAGCLQIAVQIRRGDLPTLANSVEELDRQPLVVVRWGTSAGITDDDLKRLWQQLWHAANLLVPAAATWLVADESCSLSALSAAVAYQPRLEIGPEWTEACELVHNSLAGLVSSLAIGGLPAPVIGYELIDGSGCVVGEAEMAWPADRVAVVLTSDLISVFSAAGWTVIVADDQQIETHLEQCLSVVTGKESGVH